ncbi:stigma-specific STIG1-like protein 3 [Macadamia integrifolia]|uniref:stigma-specific STIG1-like protein 3 n=1 Tax=Macadamia integrifolia TaxID=60698 RepID=UPI001C52E704|nr:stigma-specific STIG1-like protein 3 [Macadamia integrifolia]
MESMIKPLFMLLLAMVLVLSNVVALTNKEMPNLDGEPDSLELPENDEETSQRVISRFLTQETLSGHCKLTCDKFPRICRAKGSAWPDCCKKKCVNVMTVRLNCGWCGNKCKYSEICCKGKCVNPMFNKSHCCRCHNRCKKGECCSYGLCNYS